MSRSDVELAAVAWREARLRACAAPLGDPTVWTDLGAAETALSEAVVAHLEAERYRQELRDGAAAAKAAWDARGGVAVHPRFAARRDQDGAPDGR
jgi:hypothetical protein